MTFGEFCIRMLGAGVVSITVMAFFFARFFGLKFSIDAIGNIALMCLGFFAFGTLVCVVMMMLDNQR